MERRRPPNTHTHTHTGGTEKREDVGVSRRGSRWQHASASCVFPLFPCCCSPLGTLLCVCVCVCFPHPLRVHFCAVLFCFETPLWGGTPLHFGHAHCTWMCDALIVPVNAEVWFCMFVLLSWWSAVCVCVCACVCRPHWTSFNPLSPRC